MAKRLAIPSKETQLHIVGPRDVFKASRVQRFSLGTDVPSTTVDEIGNRLHVGDSKDTPNVTLTFSAFDTSIKIFAAMTGQDPDSYPAEGVDIVNLTEIDAVLFTKDATLEDYVKSGHARRLQIRDFTFNYSVDGESTEEYTAVGSERRWLRYDVVMDTFDSGTTSFELSETPIQLKNGNYLLSLRLDGDYLTETTDTPETGEYSISGTTVTTYDTRTSRVIAVYHAQPSGTNWADVSDPLIPVAVKGKDVAISILANSIPRVQSVSINGNLSTQTVKELGNRSIVGYQRQIPNIEGTITVLDTDTELIALLTEGLTTSGIEWQPGEGCTTTDLSLTIELMDPCDTTSPYTVLKTVYLPSISIMGDSYTQNVNNNAQIVFNFKSEDAQCIIYSGAIA